MITLKNVNKYFFRFKKNEIHVINDTSLEFGKTGLVALLGPSGCGKTTLLNAIGGLDKINSGSIYINGKKMPKRGSARKDKMRVMNIGYIFQNYNLLDNFSVFENVALSLKMVGIRNSSEIKRRVDYILETTGMYRYRNKPAGMLSGGQRQRVGIARALVKNPDVIIADEPTGNLDSKNTIEIMNIIKAISKDKLVILVTHEKNLAEFYASRIIKLEDGKIISDEDNIHENELDYRIDNKIYLKDIENEKKISIEDKKINLYYDKDEKISLDIVIKNGNIYIKSNENKKIEVVDEYSGVEFIDDKYKKISKDDYEKTKFDLSMLDNSASRLHYSSIYNVFTMIKAGFKRLANYTFMKKILLIGFLVSSMFIVYSVASMFGVTNIQDKNFINTYKDYIKVENNKNSLEDFEKMESKSGISYVIPGNAEVTFTIKNESLFQLMNAVERVTGSLVAVDLLDENKIVAGRLPQNSGEIVVDRMTIEQAVAMNTSLKMLGLKYYQDFVGYTVTIGNLKREIVGIADTSSPSIFASKEDFINMIEVGDSGNDTIVSGDPSSEQVVNYELHKEDLTIKGGHEPREDYEVIVNEQNKGVFPLNKTIEATVNGKKLKVVGYYHSKRGDTSYFVSSNTYRIDVITKSQGMMIIAKNKEEALSELKDEGYNAIDTYQTSRDEYIKSVKDSTIQSLIIAGILLAISFVEIYLMIRASFLSRIKEVGIYRAIGVKKGDIYKMFLGEILVITTITGLPGAALMISVLKEITKISFFGTKFVMDARVIIISFILIYGLNIIVGLLPIRQTIRKTPAEILSRNDVD